jgi:hypothetical protein
MRWAAHQRKVHTMFLKENLDERDNSSNLSIDIKII